jgi:hypothetical protein
MRWVGESGKKLSAYNGFRNKDQWSVASGIEDYDPCRGENPGDIPAPFFYSKPQSSTTTAGTTIKVGRAEITVTLDTIGLQWDSKTGIVSGLVSGVRKPVPYTGNSLGAIPVGGLTGSSNGRTPPSTTLSLNGGTLDYDYWYY